MTFGLETPSPSNDSTLPPPVYHPSLSQSPQPALPSASPVEKAYHSKRPHKKSRMGCHSCKARKVKCDETRPACRSCTLRKTECIYPTPPSPKSDGEGKVLTVRSRSPLSADKGEVVVFGELGQRPLGFQVDDLDMKLLWWYTTKTYTSFAVDGGRSTGLETVLKIDLVQLAFQYPFLMNTLLAMTSLHLQVLDKQVPQVRALAYSARAFNGYRQAVAVGNPETYPALLVCSLLLCGLSSQAFRDPDTKPLYILDWMIVWRGIHVIIDMTKSRNMDDFGLMKLFFRPKIDLDETVRFIPNRLLFLVETIDIAEPDYQYKKTYYQTLKYLGSIYKELQLEGFSPILDLRIITFFTFLPQQYVDLARAKRPIALVILAHYVMFLSLAESVWWVRGIAGGQVKGLANELGTNWHLVLQVPAASLNATSQVDKARIILEDPNWTPPRGGKYSATDLRCRELCWVDDWGREVLESGVIESTSPKCGWNSPLGWPDDSKARVETEKQKTRNPGCGFLPLQVPSSESRQN